MSDTEARREARRRKILENSEKRLQKITGVQKRNVSYELEGYKSPQNVDEIFSENLINRGVPTNESVNGSQLSLEPEHVHRNSFINANSVSANSPASPKKICFTAYRVPIIVFIAFMVNILLCVFENKDYHIVNQIFIPLLSFEAVDLLYNQNEANNDFAKYLIFFRNIPQYQLVWIVKYLGILKTIFRDVMIYFFVFVCLLYIRSVFTNNLATNFVF